MDPVKKELYTLHHCDAIEWLRGRRANSIHAVVTDPPHGLVEYTEKELKRLAKGNGIWRLPNKRDGVDRQPTPRFTALTLQDRMRLRALVLRVSAELHRVLVPGAHVFWSTHPLFSHIVSSAFAEVGFEKRGAVIRIVKTLRGGERPKGAHKEFPMVCVLPRACWEPWVIFRKPLRGTMRENLKRYRTGGLRRIGTDEPFRDLIPSSPARNAERELARHPSLKPQAFVRQIVHASLPLGKGLILDPFMGSGSTIAAATHLGLRSIGVEKVRAYFDMACEAIPKLAALEVSDRRPTKKRPKKGTSR